MTEGPNRPERPGSDPQPSRPVAIVLDGNQRSALATTRSLGAHGIPVWVADSTSRPLASTSRFALKSLQYPDPTKVRGQFIAWLGSINSQYPGSILFPLTDITVPITLQASSQIGRLLTALPSSTSYEIASDKAQLLKLATAVGVQAPRTWSVTTRTRGTPLPSVTFPVVVKPTRSATSIQGQIRKRSVTYAQSPDDLARAIDAQLLNDSDELLIQEYIEGSGAGIFALYDRSKPIYFFSHRRLRERPPTGGVSVLSESTPPPPEGLAAAKRLLDALQWHGVAMVEFKIDRNGRLWLMEINARLWGSLQLAVDCGADFPWWLYQLALGSHVTAAHQYDVGRQLRWWLGDLDNLYARLRDSHQTPTLSSKVSAIGNFMIPWQPRMRYELFRWQDPSPAIAATKDYLLALIRSRAD